MTDARAGTTIRVWFAALAAVVLVIAVVAVTYGRVGLGSEETEDGYALEGRTTAPPWPIPADPRTLVQAAGLDLGPMGMAEHYHPELTIQVDGAEVPVPANIGVDPASGAMSALHTHTPDGVLHVEADSVGQEFTLGQLFTQWNVYLSDTQIGGVSGELSVSVNGEAYGDDPSGLVLAPKQRIAIEVQT